MKIGFSNGDFFKLYASPNDRFSKAYLSCFGVGGAAQAIELSLLDEAMVDYALADNDIDLSAFESVSLHAPSFPYADDENSRRLLSKLERLSKEYDAVNVVFHPDQVLDWNIFAGYSIPVSIENMDANKKFGKTVFDIKPILDKHGFKLTLDLQHCFMNDQTMQLARDFHQELGDRIVEYHISGFMDDDILHHPLYKTRQDKILDSVMYRHVPLIIESTLDKLGNHDKELAYIKNYFDNRPYKQV